LLLLLHTQLQIQRIYGVHPGALHFVSGEMVVLKAVALQDLVVSEVESSLHLV
jgi:hypothetical protein